MLLQQPRIKIHGCMKSGTNLLEFFLRNYFEFDPMVNERAWKHGPINEELAASHIIIYKDVFAWLHSMHNYLVWYRKNKPKQYFMKSSAANLKEFIRRRFVYTMNEQRQDYANPVLIYRDSHQSWLESKCRGAKVFVRYEELLTRTEPVLDEICNIVSHNCGGRKILYPVGQQSYDGFKDRTAAAEQKYEKIKFYRNREYMNFYDNSDLDFVNGIVGLELPTELAVNSIQVE